MAQRRLSIYLSTAFATGLSLLANGSAFAADAAATPPKHNSADTTFVDLTGGRSTVTAEPMTTDTTQTRVLNLSNGAPPTEMTPPPPPLPVSRVPRTKTIDLAVPGSEATATVRTDADYYPVESELVIVTADRDNDPYEEDNRSRFQSHVWLHHNFFDPIESLYIGIVPPFMREGVHNFVLNLESPTIFVNDMLQVDPARAGGTLGRFVVNSTVGVGGLFDVGTWAGIPYRDNDFGMTLANYGVGDYPYLLIPLIGPSNPRDLTGKVVDVFINPLHYVTIPGGIFTDLGEESLKQGDTRSYEVGKLDALVDNEPDPYAAERHEAREKRQAGIDSGGLEDDETP